MYSLEKHRFVAYATSAIKNNIGDLIKRIKTKNSTEGNDALSLHDNFEGDLPSEEISIETSLCEACDYEDLKSSLKNLNEDEIELINLIFYKNYTVREYAYFKNICYSKEENYFKKNL